MLLRVNLTLSCINYNQCCCEECIDHTFCCQHTLKQVAVHFAEKDHYKSIWMCATVDCKARNVDNIVWNKRHTNTKDHMFYHLTLWTIHCRKIYRGRVQITYRVDLIVIQNTGNWYIGSIGFWGRGKWFSMRCNLHKSRCSHTKKGTWLISPMALTG